MYKIIGANQAEYGPVSADQLRQWITEGRVNAETLAQAAGETGWKPISTYAEFAEVFTPKPAAPPPMGKSPPSFTAGASSLGGREAVLSEVSGPAIALIVVGALSIVAGGFGVIKNLIVLTVGAGGMNSMTFPGRDPQLMRFAQTFSGGFGIVFALIVMGLGAFYIYGGIKMKALEKHGLCMMASILACIPCFSCCCVGIPVGIWALVVLNKAETKAHFTS